MSKLDEKMMERQNYVDEQLDTLKEENICLKEKTDDLEQRGRLENLRIFGIKESVNEDTNTLVIEVAKKVNVTLDPSCISRSHRVGPKSEGKIRAIIVKFVSSADRQRLFLAKKKLKGTHITIREDLTKVRQDILKSATENYDSVWSHNGVILVKLGHRIHRVQTQRQFETLLKEHPPKK